MVDIIYHQVKYQNPPTMATIINRDFYKSLRKRGKNVTTKSIMRMIQPERLDQFLPKIYNSIA